MSDIGYTSPEWREKGHLFDTARQDCPICRAPWHPCLPVPPCLRADQLWLSGQWTTMPAKSTK